MAFPKNPKTGDIVQIENNLCYIYDGTLNVWHKQEGGTVSLATPLMSGLMSSVDLKKLNGLIVPPPQTTITSATSSYSFNSGTIALMSGDEFVKINSNAKISTTMDIARQLHQNTYAFDFTIDTSAFFQYMVESGRFVVVSPRGLRGDKGDTGPAGENNLPFGPDGEAGDNGANAEFNLTIQPEPVSLERVNDSHLAVTSLTTEEISDTENYLVVTRSIIGNPDACPSSLRLSSTSKSSWLIALPSTASSAIITWLPESCYDSSQQVYYIDISSILNSIETEFNREVTAIKSDCENIVQFWLSIMAGLFDEQKAALCCALEYCESQTRNAETRRYIEEQRIQASQAVTLKGSTSTAVTVVDPTSGTTTTVTNQSINSTAQSIVIDGNPLQSGKSVVNTTVMDSACGVGFGAKNIHNLPNNQDPVGGSACVPGIVLYEGKALKYDECPPGFIPRYVERDAVLTSTSAEIVTTEYPADYSVDLDIPTTGSGTSTVYQGSIYGKVTPGVNLYLPPGISLARKLAINAFRSNNPITSSELRVTITGTTLSWCKSVTVYVKSTSGTILAYGQTDSDGDIYFKNLSSLEKYNITISKTGYLFTPDGWSLVQPTVLEIVSLTSTITAGAAATAVQQIVTCSSGTNVLVVTVAGDVEGINSTWISIRYYATGYPLCSAYAGTSTTNQGEIVFTGIPDGLWVVYGGTDETSETDPYYYEVDQPCHPVANPISQQAVELRSCNTVQFVHRTDGGQNLARMTFNVLTKSKDISTSDWVVAASIPAELVVPGDARFESLIKQQVESNPNSRVSLSEALLMFNTNEPFAFEIDSDVEFKIYYLESFGADYNNNIGMMLSDNNKFYDKLVSGIYNICIVSDTLATKFHLKSLTQNIQFIKGVGNGWSNALLQDNNTAINSNKGLDGVLWLQMRIIHPHQLQYPYSSNCGAVGPRSSKTDRRFCRELPNGTGSILTRNFIIGDGLISQWFTSRCGSFKVPDAIEMTIEHPFAINNLILCRVAHNAYSGGFNIDGRSAQIIIEQISPINIQPGQYTDSIGGNDYRCTLLGWNSDDCIGDISNFGSVIVEADCSNWSIAGTWVMANKEVKFNAKAIENLSKDGSIELILNVSDDNTGFFKSVNTELPKGEYIVDIVDCCFRSGGQYTGHVEIEYQSQNGKSTKRFPSFGAFNDEDIARSNYRGLTLEIIHNGGQIVAKLVSPVLLDGSGKIGVRFTTKDAFNHELETLRFDESCAVSYAQVKSMEEWHLSHNGTVIDIAGQDYIIIDGLINNMQDCIEKYNNPKFVWPTLDGKHFTNVPDSGIIFFKRIPQLEATIKLEIPENSTNTILFPIL
jgi:hypothetical protein